MKALRTIEALVLAVALAGAAGCAGSDGGPVGTGIVASVAGNVISVDSAPGQASEAGAPTATAAADATPADLPPIEVSIDEVPNSTTTTDADGNFSIDGGFSGRITLRFRTAGVDATQVVDVPAGALVVLADVALAPGQVDAEAGRQVGFLGRLVSSDCAAGILTVDDERPEPGTFEVAIVTETRIAKPNGHPLECADIPVGERIAIDAVFEPGSDARAVALSVTVGARRRKRADVLEDVPFLGFAASLGCDAGVITLADDDQRTRLRLTAETEIVDADGKTLTCGDIRLGDQLVGLGTLSIHRPGAIAATRITVTPSGGRRVALRLLGAIAGKDCDASVLQLADHGGIAAVRLLPSTTIEPPLSCADLQIGERVRGRGRVDRMVPNLIDAVRLRIRPPARSAADKNR